MEYVSSSLVHFRFAISSAVTDSYERSKLMSTNNTINGEMRKPIFLLTQIHISDDVGQDQSTNKCSSLIIICCIVGPHKFCQEIQLHCLTELTLVIRTSWCENVISYRVGVYNCPGIYKQTVLIRSILSIAIGLKHISNLHSRFCISTFLANADKLQIEFLLIWLEFTSNTNHHLSLTTDLFHTVTQFYSQIYIHTNSFQISILMTIYGRSLMDLFSDSLLLSINGYFE